MSGLGSIQASPFKPFTDVAAEPCEDAMSTSNSDMDTDSMTSGATGTTMTSVAGNEMITQIEVDEEQKLQDKAEQEEQDELKKRKEMWLHMEQDSKEERYRRLQVLLMKSNMYTEYLLSRMDRQKEEERKRRQRNMKKMATAEQKKKDKQLKTEKQAKECVKQDTDIKVETEGGKENSVPENTDQTNISNSQNSTSSSDSTRKTRSKLTLRAPVPKSRISNSNNNSPATSSNTPALPIKTEKQSPATPGKESSKTPNIECAKSDLPVEEPIEMENKSAESSSQKEHNTVLENKSAESSSEIKHTTTLENKSAESSSEIKHTTKLENESAESSSEIKHTTTLENKNAESSDLKDTTTPSIKEVALPSNEETCSPGSEKENDGPSSGKRRSSRLSTPNVEDFADCLRGYLGEMLIPADREVESAEDENEEPIPEYSTSKRGRKRKNQNYNEQSPQGAKLLTHFFKSNSKRRKLEVDAENDTQEQEEVKDKIKAVTPSMDLFTGFPDIEADGTITRPALLTGGILRRYQIEGLNWLKVLFENGVNGILADEMGLGKTIQCVSLLCQIITMGATGPFMVVAPLSTLPNWKNEFQRFAPRMPVVFYHGSKEERNKLQGKIARWHNVLHDIRIQPVVITSYEIAMIDRPALSRFSWTYMIVDEGHRIKNKNCRLIKELKLYKNSHRLLLTGTPLQNNLQELWSLLNFLLPEIFDDLGSFETWFDVKLISDESADEAIIEEEKKSNILGMLHQILTPFMLRRVKADVDLDIPPKKELLVLCPLSEVQREFYETTVDKTIFAKMKLKYEPEEAEVELDAKGRPKRGNARTKRDKLADAGDSEVTLKQKNIMMQLRKVCNHPYLLEYPLDPAGNYLMDEDLVWKCGKMMMLDKMLTRLRLRGHKVLIFSQMTKMLDILQDYLCIRDINFCRLDGSCSIEDRQESMNLFNNDPDVWVFLLSTRAGGLGVNLVAADTVIIYDSDWNPQCDLQAQDRCHRIGQSKPVLVYRFVTANTIDQKIVERAAAKRKLEKMIIHKGKFKSGINNFSTEMKPLCPEELMELLKSKDHSGVVEKTRDGEVISKEDLDALLDRSDLVKEFEENKRLRKGQARC